MDETFMCLYRLRSFTDRQQPKYGKSFYGKSEIILKPEAFLDSGLIEKKRYLAGATRRPTTEQNLTRGLTRSFSRGTMHNQQ